MKKLILCAMLALAATAAQANEDSGLITCYKGNGDPAWVDKIQLDQARFLDFSLSSDGYYRVRLANGKLYLLPIANCYLSLD